MALDSDRLMSSRSFQPYASFGGRDFWLIPKDDDGGPLRAQPKHPELLNFDHPNIRKFHEYEYTRLRSDKKRIRLMKLYPGEVSGTEIYCELIEVEYQNKFHIPTKIQEDDTQKGKSRNSRGDSIIDDTEDDGDRSDLETLWQEKPESEAEELAREKRQEVRDVLKLAKELRLAEGRENDRNEEQRKEKKRNEELFSEYEMAKKNEQQYEALSWCWGDEKENYAVLIKIGKETFRKRVRRELALALKYLRRAGKERIIWVDAICIDQGNAEERNHQVQMMSRVYTRAQQVCIWLGEADTESAIAIKFIKSEIMDLRNFDTISSDEQYSRKWRALMSLMQRDWFFRRWVVQEIALSRAATVYCGPHSVPWKSFAVAVELFVEVETATHRLSEVMKRDEKFRHVPGWFEYVSELGASLLVQATGKVFRMRRTPMQQDPDSSEEEAEHGTKRDKKVDKQQKKKREEEEERQTRERIREAQTIDPLERRSLLSLEYLVSTMFIFQASEPRDVVYALLAIARDASPFAPAQYGQDDQNLFLVMTLLDRFLAEKPFLVDYNRPYSDVSADFVEFSIGQTFKADPTQALDILCRPWALEPPTKRSTRLKNKANSDGKDPKKRRLMTKRKSWKICERQVEMKENGVWQKGDREFRYRYLEIETPNWKEDRRENIAYRKETMTKQVWRSPCSESGCTHAEGSGCTGIEWRPSGGWSSIQKKYFPNGEDSNQAEEDIELPSWVARASQAPFMLDHAPGMEMRKTSRANADPLVGSPQDGHRNYNAAGSEKLDLKALEFKKRPVMGQYSLYVKGFELDEVLEVEDASQLGSIPRTWLAMAKWDDLTEDPPDEFWRTLVADRGRENRNPPYYYARACKESVHKGGLLGGSVNTTALINDERNSIIAEFCRRVHAVIWNRCLFRTKKDRLGLANKVKAGDKVCILYGCTVPVILEKKEKKPEDLEQETVEDRVESLKACIRRAEINRERKAKYRPKKKEYTAEMWEEMMDARKAHLKQRSREKDAYRKTADEQRKEENVKRNRKASKLMLAKQIKEANDTKEKACFDVAEAEKKKEAAEKITEAAAHKPPAAFDAAEDGKVAAAEQAINKANMDIDNGGIAIKQADEKRAAALQAAEDSVENAGQEADEMRTTTLQAAKDSAENGATILAANGGMAAGGSDGGDSGTGESNTGQPTTTGGSNTPESQAKATNDTGPTKAQKNREPFVYKLKGECYLHGMMDGEAIRQKFYDDLQDKIFELI